MERNSGVLIAFHLLCVVVTFSMMLYGTIKYLKDESTSIVDSKAFHATEDDIYPTLSFCLEVDIFGMKWYDPHHSLTLYNEKLDSKTRRDYVNFLMGNKTDDIEKLIDVDYDDATFDLNDYLERVLINSGNKVLYEWELKPSNQNGSKPLLVSYRHPLLKCFSFDVSNAVPDAVEKGTAISSFAIFFGRNNPMFNAQSTLIMSYFLHYPKQLMRSTALERDHLGIMASVFTKNFNIDNVEVIRKRNTRVSLCNENYKEDDDVIRKGLIKEAGCTPSHWPIDKDYKARCKTKEQMTVVGTPLLETIHPEFLNKFKNEEPCNQIYGIAYTFKDLKTPPFCNPTSQSPMCISPPIKTISVVLKNANYKEIKHIQAFNIESWVGNVGGYVGLFLGCAIWQAPDFIQFVCRKTKGIAKTIYGVTQ